jgi:hypothetical protein
LLSGDFVFVGDVGRPDLLESAGGQAGAMEPRARELFNSIQAFRGLNPSIQLWPAHGAGSACGKALGAVPMSTVGYELVANRSIAAATDPDAFVAYILEGQPEPPLYFARMKRDNRSGPAVLASLPEPRKLPQSKVADLSGATGVAVLDTRTWDEYRHAHLPGALFTPLNSQFNTIAAATCPRRCRSFFSSMSRACANHRRPDPCRLDHIVGYFTPTCSRVRPKGKNRVDRPDRRAGCRPHGRVGCVSARRSRSAELIEAGAFHRAQHRAHAPARAHRRGAEGHTGGGPLSSGSRSRYAADCSTASVTALPTSPADSKRGRRRARGCHGVTRLCALRRRSHHAVSRLWWGAVGSVLGGMLSLNHHDVCLVGREPHVDAIKRDGLRIKSPPPSTTPIPPRCVTRVRCRRQNGLRHPRRENTESRRALDAIAPVVKPARRAVHPDASPRKNRVRATSPTSMVASCA